MKGDLISDDERLVRYCKPSSLDDELRPSAASFMLRSDEPYLSVLLFDRFNGANDEERITTLRIRTHRRLMEFNRTAKLAILRTGEMRAQVNAFATDHRWVRVLHEPVVNPIQYDEHAGIYDTAADEENIAEIISEKVQGIYPALDA